MNLRKIFAVIIFSVLLLNLTACTRNNPAAVQELTDKGSELFNQGDYAGAINYYNQLIETSPKNAEAFGRLGEAYSRIGDYDSVIKYCQKAVEINPKLAPAWYLMGFAGNKLGDYAKAIEYCSKAVEIDPKLTLAWNNLGFAYNNSGDYAKGIASLNKAVELEPKYANAWSNLAFAYVMQKDYDKTIECLQKAVEFDSKMAAAWGNLGYMYEMKGRYKEAADAYGRAAELEPDNEKYRESRSKSFYYAPSLENYIDWSRVPKIGTKKELAEYISNCERNSQTVIPVVLTNGLMVKEELTYMTNVDVGVSYKILSGGGKDSRMIYEIQRYPGTKVAQAYLSGDKSGLSADEMRLYDIAVEIVNEANRQPSALRKELFIHDAITSRTTYYTEENHIGLPRFVTAIGALIDGQANCQGYSDAFYMLGTMCGLNIGKMKGQAGGGGHMWNTIDFGDGKIYCVDVTWDDGKIRFQDGGTEYNSYVYFNAPSEIMQADHSWTKEYAPKLQPSIDERYYYCTQEFYESGGEYFGVYIIGAREGLQYIAKNMALERQPLIRVMSLYDSAYSSEDNHAAEFVSSVLRRDYAGYPVSGVINTIHTGSYLYYTVVNY